MGVSRDEQRKKVTIYGKFESKMESPNTGMEKAGKAVARNYENLLQNYHPGLMKMIQAATNMNQAYFELARTQSVYIKSLNDLKDIAESGGVTGGVVDNIDEVATMLSKVNGELTDFQKVFPSDLIHPFESKLMTDQTYLETELSGFRDNWNKAMTDLVAKEEKTLAKSQKNRGKSKKDDQKRIALESEKISAGTKSSLFVHCGET